MASAEASRTPRWLPVALILWVVVGFVALLLAESLVGKIVTGGVAGFGFLVLARPYLLSLYGPVMAYDFVRVGRKPRVIWFRLVYASVMAIVFVWIYVTGIYLSERYAGTTLQTKELARIAETFFDTFMVIQFLLVCLLTPALVGGAIADEKERRTLEFLLATDLRDREILFGKLASRVGSLLLFLAAGLPILGMIQFFGGIDPNLVLAGFVMTMMTILGLAAVAIAASTASRKARDAIVLTYLLAVAYIVVSIIIFGLAESPWFRGTFEFLGYTISTSDCAYPVVAGNPFYQVAAHSERRGMRTATALFEGVRDYTIFHSIVILLFVGWSAWRLRAIALNQLFGSKSLSLRKLFKAKAKAPTPTDTPSRPTTKQQAVRVHGTTTLFKRPEVGDSPIMWKEVFVDAGLRLGLFAKIVVWGLIALSFVPIGFIVWDVWFESYSWRSSWASAWEEMGERMNAFARVVGVAVSTMLFLAVTVRGAGAVSGERDKHTLDVLLTTPLSAKKILWGKWWGCLLGLRWGWAWLLLVWVVSMALGGLYPLMLLPLIFSTAVYAAGAAWIGIACSLHFTTTLKASMMAILISVFLGGGYFLVFVFCCLVPLSFGGGGPGRDMDTVVDALCSPSPPVTMAWLPMNELKDRELELFSRDIPYIPFWLLGLMAWGCMSLILANTSMTKFRRLANRLPMRPDESPWETTGPARSS